MSAQQEVLQHLVELSKAGATMTRSALQKPLYGGAFGGGGFSLCSLVRVRSGLHAVVFFVVHDRSGVLIGQGETKDQALSDARRMLRAAGGVSLAVLCDRVAQQLEDQRREAQQKRLASAASSTPARVPSIPRRRRQIFESSGGKCHYCGTALTLDGRWHIEHRMPKALMGGNEPANLVASCVPCNMQKRDRTDVEFLADRAGRDS